MIFAPMDMYTNKKPPIMDDSLFGRDNQIHLELLDFIVHEPELSDRLLNDLEDIFRSVERRKTIEGVLV